MKYESLKHFDLAYCITVHKAQGSTFNFEFSIYEYSRFDKKLLYTAMSRSTQKSFINFMPYYPATKKGYIYKISNESGRVYIGSTVNTEERWAQHKESKETDKFHTEMRANPDGWTFEIIQNVDFLDVETLLIAETTQIMRHNSVSNGFNSKFPIDITNIY
jgi:predicted GIY-YIG superfamily endonuclease